MRKLIKTNFLFERKKVKKLKKTHKKIKTKNTQVRE